MFTISLLLLLPIVTADAISDFQELETLFESITNQLAASVTAPNITGFRNSFNTTYGSYPMAYGTDYVGNSPKTNSNMKTH